MSRAVRLVAVSAAMLVACVAGAGTALATVGQYTIEYNGNSTCGAFTPSVSSYYTLSCNGGLRITATGTSVPNPSEANITAKVPTGSGLTITAARGEYSTSGTFQQAGWGGGDFHQGGNGGSAWPASTSSSFSDAGYSSEEWGFQLLCNNGSTPTCLREQAGTQPPSLGPATSVVVSSVDLTVNEPNSPSLGAPGPKNLYNQTGRYVWNPAGDPWPVTLSGSDVSGICSANAVVNGQPLSPALHVQANIDQETWQQCSNGAWSGLIDTRHYLSTSGSLALTLEDTNRASRTSSTSRTLKVDNDPVVVSLNAPSVPDTSQWVNHAVSLTARATAGPSGISRLSCAVDGHTPFAYGKAGISVNGNGAHRVVCIAYNRAVDPQGALNHGSAARTVKIDEAPPSVQFAPVNPSNPTQLVVQTSDPESGVAGGLITMQGPHAKRAKTLSANLAGSDLLSRFNDGGKNGTYTFTATACDHVGNCASTKEHLHFPIRLGARSAVSFAKIETPARTAFRRVRVGFHYKTVHRRRDGRRVTRRIKVGGHIKRVKVVIHANRRCGQRRIKTGHHRWREISVCRTLKLRIVSHRQVAFGQEAKLHGLLTTAQGAPIANSRVKILTRPNDRGGIYRLATTATTDAHGRWVAKIPGGPSRAIRAYYPGAADVEPATARANLTVPAKIRLRIAPRVLPWSHAIQIKGHLVGRYVPHDGVALRLLVRYPHTHAWTPLQALRTNRHGAFRFFWSYHAGRGIATYPFKIATTATETDYPYAAGASPAVKVTFGKPTPHRHRRGR